MALSNPETRKIDAQLKLQLGQHATVGKEMRHAKEGAELGRLPKVDAVWEAKGDLNEALALEPAGEDRGAADCVDLLCLGPHDGGQSAVVGIQKQMDPCLAHRRAFGRLAVGGYGVLDTGLRGMKARWQPRRQLKRKVKAQLGTGGDGDLACRQQVRRAQGDDGVRAVRRVMVRREWPLLSVECVVYVTCGERGEGAVSEWEGDDCGETSD
jgi:hypothetical protein